MMDKTTTLAHYCTLYTHLHIHAGVGYMRVGGGGRAFSGPAKLYVRTCICCSWCLQHSTAQMGHQDYVILLLYGPDCDGLVSMMQQSTTSGCPVSSWLRSKSRLLLTVYM